MIKLNDAEAHIAEVAVSHLASSRILEDRDGFLLFVKGLPNANVERLSTNLHKVHAKINIRLFSLASYDKHDNIIDSQTGEYGSVISIHKLQVNESLASLWLIVADSRKGEEGYEVKLNKSKKGWHVLSFKKMYTT